MGHTRRTIDRRRRVFYTSQQADNAPPTAASRREAERLREARKPSEAYGARVQRRIRGRWFSLVPVKQRTAAIVSTLMLGGSLLLCFAHYLSVSWPLIAGNEAITRPLRLDRADSFGSWVSTMLLAASAGVTLLIYQLRRYRIDDYRGQYRIWRLVLIVTLLASVNSLTSTLDWGGALIDLVFGKRVALSGSGWLRLLITIGGAILSLRLIAEVRFSRWSMGMMIASWVMLAIPAAVHWNLLKVETLATWTLVTSAPLLSSTTVFLALGLYLRMLYREVLKVEDSATLSERFQRMRQQMFEREPETVRDRQDEGDPQDTVETEPALRQRTNARPTAKVTQKAESESTTGPDKRQRATEITSADDDEPAKPKQKEGSLWSRMRGKGRPTEQADDAPEAEIASPKTRGRRDVDGEESDQEPETAAGKKRWWNRKRNAAEETDDQAEPLADANSDDDDSPTAKRRWLGLRRGKDPAAENDESSVDDQPAPKKKRGGFSLRLRPQSQSDDADQDHDEPANSDDEAASEPKKKRGIGGWLKRRGPDTDDADIEPNDTGSNASDVEAQTRGHQTRRDDPHDNRRDEDDFIDENDIDWGSLSKAERRRLRKQLKRQGNAA